MARQGQTYESRKVFPGKVISKLGAKRLRRNKQAQGGQEITCRSPGTDWNRIKYIDREKK